ncbi:hypothetical protein SDC9_69916 [bioreactor metagenome]|uniref:FRG domain-containing protein n=2 Tax=root TaxID=1 RepID=A0A212K4L9_9BACT|nr:FRG domain-containing protein [Desulfovibrio desulfuricans]MCB6543474.1 FRG domain-containing protein [Desulfovibrio desulfuricans]MCB6554562.1 FRG domain-containing protein [Desulfovibrio desulfuricans]MCB6566413.1 FRG domain-containing protein [Desulfovibrio desulfuricans]MCB7347545.1 FRG domain-containing protein [Desulfovibrio desulfuricans]MCQ4861541.1 FRG domain-containing protein [Desulfovibrio desulfuricans]
MDDRILEIKISSLADYVSATAIFERGAGFRGVPDSEFLLLPTAGRLKPGYSRPGALWLERSMFVSFKQYAYAFEKTEKYIDLAILGQHYGLPTRLMDWTVSPLVALFFAVRSHPDRDAAVYVLDEGHESYARDEIPYADFIMNESKPAMREFLKSKFYRKKENDLEAYLQFILHREEFSVVRAFPKNISPRISAQSSFFTLHIDPFTPLTEHISKKIIISKKLKKEIFFALEKNGIHEFTLFPGLEGLCGWLKTVYYDQCLTGGQFD